ncbi:tripartite tricarboxylate transporter TctB family protein [Poseidonocella sp. HB161398]|uniref:tripartite tricarboxylate transporter TctB family protein n=1 Tax=Poseidonocella sp. HB161398 TaxID=2320855 RepID=UPI00110989FC|nr:tripartite tricarboxylate transporter TctB family protein [Poseidonocella sp. HB161398]
MNPNRFAALAFFGVALVLILSNRTLGTIDMAGDPGPLLMPRLVGGLMLALSVLLALAPAPRAASGEEPPAPATPSALPLPAIAGLVAAALCYALLFSRIGFTLSTAGFLTAAILCFGPRGPRAIAVAAATGAGVALVLGFLLQTVLGVYLPGVLV